jgi:hypothetical protein
MSFRSEISCGPNLPPSRTASISCLRRGNRQHEALLQTVEDARKNGHVDVAEIFHRHAKSLESRIHKVRDAFTLHDSTKLIALPDAISLPISTPTR